MSTIGRRVCALVVMIVAVLSLAVIPSRASEAGCAPSIGERVPIVLVHGLSGKPDDWSRGKVSMIDALKTVRGIYVGEESAFDYSKYNQEWVDNNNIGPALARRIACFAISSRQAGGSGRVVVIAHSMGGLATRFAAALAVNGRRLSQDIGLVVTIGTPNTGSGWANAWSGALRHVICPARLLFGEHVSGNNSCALTAVSGLRNSSRQIQELAWLPGSIPVRAIAGDVTVTFPIFQTTLKETDSDLIVSKKSALKGMATPESGGGQTVVRCTVSVQRLRELAARWALKMETLPSCYHGNLPHDKEVEAATVEAIRKYQASLAFGKFVGRWDVHGIVLRIKGDQTGQMAWAAGSCGLTDTNCNGIGRVKFAIEGDSIRGTFTSVRYESWTGESLPPDFTPPEGYFQVGDIVRFRLIARGVLKHLTADGGNPYFCAESASEEWHFKCNA